MTAPESDVAPISGEHIPAGALPRSEVAEYDRIAAGLAALRQEAALSNFDLSTTAGDKAARAVRARHVDLRVRVESLRVSAKQPHLDAGRQIDAAAKFLTAEIERSEKPLDAAIVAKQREKEEEKARLAQAERERVAAIDKRISWIVSQPAEAAKRRKADEISAILEALRSVPLTPALYAEKLPEALGAHLTAIAAIEQMLEVAREREAEDARLAAERERLAAERAAEDARRKEEDRKRREAQEAEDRERRERQAREDAERAERQRAEDERLAAARTEAERIEREAREAREREEKAAREARELQEKEDAERRRRIRSEIEARADPWSAIDRAIYELHEERFGHALRVLEDAVEARTELNELDAATL